MRSRRIAIPLAGFALVVAACGGGAADVADPGSAPAETTQPTQPSAATPEATEPSTAPSEETSGDTLSAGSERPAPDPDRVIAPDFTLGLGDGSTFVLSEETRPVFMVFWAEW